MTAALTNFKRKRNTSIDPHFNEFFSTTAHTRAVHTRIFFTTAAALFFRKSLAVLTACIDIYVYNAYIYAHKVGINYIYICYSITFTRGGRWLKTRRARLYSPANNSRLARAD